MPSIFLKSSHFKCDSFEFLYLIKSGIICHKDAAIMHMLLRRHVLLTLTQTSFPPKDNKNKNNYAISYNASTNASNKDSVHSFSLSLYHRGNRFTSFYLVGIQTYLHL